MQDKARILLVFLESTSTMFMHTKVPKRWAYFAEIASFLKSKGFDVKTMDCLNPAISHGEVFSEVASHDYDVIVLIARRETVRSIYGSAHVLKDISPRTKIVVYGDMVNYVPNFFKKIRGVDAVLQSGDWESGLFDYIRYAKGEIAIDELAGVSVLHGSVWSDPPSGKMAPQEWWTFSDLESPGFIEKDLYLSLTDGEVTISTSKGCPFRCGICPAIITFGGNDRRIEVARVIEFMGRNRTRVRSFKLFSPCFTHDVIWVKDFCATLLRKDLRVQWTCTSRPDCLQDEEMIVLMGRSGCTKIALGVEALDPQSTKALRKFMDVKDYIGMVEQVFRSLQSNNIEAKPLLMLGIEGQTRENLIASFELLEKFGAKSLRCAAYSPRQRLREMDRSGTLSVSDIEKLDKMTYQNMEIPGIDRETFLKLVFSNRHFSEILPQ